jgi:preprotein translocase subunit SecF
MFSIIKLRKIWFSISSLLVISSLVALGTWGVPFGLDFTGGSLLEIEFINERPSSQQITDVLASQNLGPITIQPAGDKGMVIRFKEVDEQTHQTILNSIRSSFQPPAEERQIEQGEIVMGYEVDIFEEKRFESIGPTIGNELREKTVWALLIVLVAIVLYIAWAFRKVSKPIASWKYGVVATIALFHDIVITVGVFVVLGKFYGFEVNAPFIAALLTILGYSINDTIVVFDRARENLVKHIGEPFEEIVDMSINEVIVRSINASFTTLFVLFAVLLLGGQNVRDFVLALIIGISVGTYSSIFIASPLLVSWEKMKLFKK